jgi:hypothetical protein
VCTRSKRAINLSNVINEAFVFYKEHIYPSQPPHINTVLAYMINHGTHAPSAVWATKKDFCVTKAQIMWRMLLAPMRTQPGDTSILFFNVGAPRDPEYDGRSLQDVKQAAKDDRDALFDEHPDMDLDDIMLLHDHSVTTLPWELSTSPAESSSFMPLHEFGSKRRKVLSEPGIAGGKVPPCFSAQTSAILERRVASAQAMRLVSAISVNSAPRCASSAKIINDLFLEADDDTAGALVRQVTAEATLRE